MKKLLLLCVLFAITASSFAQQAKLPSTKKAAADTSQQPMDTVTVGSRYIIALDSLQYVNLVKFVEAMPIGDQNVQYVYSLINGNLKNIQKMPLRQLRAKPKKQ